MGLWGVVGCTGDLTVGQAAAAIIGGVPALAGDLPATGAILSGTRGVGLSFTCTGTLIAPDVVITAAHCVACAGPEWHFTLERDVRRYQEEQPDAPTDAVQARVVVQHPDFRFDTLPTGLADLHDVGLLILSSSIAGVAPEVLARDADRAALVVGATVAIAGYGRRELASPELGLKAYARSIIGEVGAAELQIGDVAPVPQKCSGDSGGPSLLDVHDGRLPRARLVGVTSRAYDPVSGCERGGVDTRVDRYVPWISGVMRAACDDGLRVSCAAWAEPPEPRAETGPPDAGAWPDAAVDAGVGDASVLDRGVAEPDAGDARDASAGASEAGPDADATGASRGDTGDVERSDAGCACVRPVSGAGLWLLLALVPLVRRRNV